MSRVAIAVGALLASGCALDPAPRRLLDGLRAGALDAELLAPDATLVTADGAVTGKAAVASGLAALRPPAGATTAAHHDVARLDLADRSMLFAKSDGRGHVTTVLLFPPGGDDPIPPAVKAYQEAWKSPYPYALLEDAWSPRGVYQDPLVDARGRAEVGRMIADLHKAYDDLAMSSAGTLQRLPGGFFTFGWKFKMGSVTIDGLDVGFLDEEGKVALISGFVSPR